LLVAVVLVMVVVALVVIEHPQEHQVEVVQQRLS
jgi:hypothetical protein